MLMKRMINRPLSYELNLNPDHSYLMGRGVPATLASYFGIGYCNHFLMDDRIAIPIHDHCGQLVAYAGRWIGTHCPQGKKLYRYTPLFNRSRLLYNLYRVRDRDTLVLVEGFFSVFRLHTLSIPSVALMGHSLSVTQEELLTESKVKTVVVMLNGNPSSRKAQRSMVARLARWFHVRSLELPQGKEPDTVDEKTLRRAQV